MKFKVGDIVELNSGGPIMTVCKCYDKTDKQDEELLCAFFVSKYPYTTTVRFPPEALKPGVETNKPLLGN